MTPTRTIAVVFHSASGRTKALAEAVGRGAAEVEGTASRVVSVEEAPRTHDVLAAADAIVFGCPTYMGSASGAFKSFMDSTSAIWALQGWRDKLAAGFTHSAAPSGDKLGTLMQLAVFAAQHGMIWVPLGLPPTYVGGEASATDLNRLGSHLGAMGQSRPGGGELPASDVKTAEHLGRRVAEAARRWETRRARRGSIAPPPEVARHPSTRGWAFPPEDRPPLPEPLERTSLREIAARPDRFEHHLMICATVDGAQLEITTASEPLYFAHINLSDEYALALPSGDELVDRFPLRTFLSDPNTGEDVGRYNHRIGDLVLHPEGLLHWPGRLRPPYEPFDFPPGMRRAGLSLVYCATKPTPPTHCPVPLPPEREGDAKPYVDPPPPMALVSMRGAPGFVARIGTTTLSLVEVPKTIAPPHGGWVVVLEADASSPHAACDLVRVPEGASMDARGVARALVLASDGAAPDPAPALWTKTPTPPFPPFEDAERGELPFESDALRVEEVSAATVAMSVGDARTEVPRHWLARMLFRAALHGYRLGYVETYGGAFLDDRGEYALIGIRTKEKKVSMAVKKADIATIVERMYRAVAPPGYRERV